MADIGQAIFSRLSTNAGVKKLVGSRIYPQTPVDAVKRPYVTYHLISMPQRAHAMGSDPGLVIDRFQIDVWAETHKKRVSVSAAVLTALSRWRGTTAGVTVNSSFNSNRRDLYEPDTKLYRRSMDFEIGWQES